MEKQRYYNLGSSQYQSINTQKISPILLKDETVLDVNKHSSPHKYGDYSFNRNYQNTYNSVNGKNNAKIRKFNSYSARVGYKNNNNEANGFYVTPIPNIPKRLIKIKVPGDKILDTQNENYHHVENVVFKASLKKYIYKPYKPPKRKNMLKPNSLQKGKSFYNYTGFNNYRKY